MYPRWLIITVGCCAVGFLLSIANLVRLSQLNKITTQWYEGELLMSVDVLSNNIPVSMNAKINRRQLGLRSDGVLVFRTNTITPIQ